MLEHSVETIVYHGVAICQLMIFPDLMPQAAVLWSECHVIHNGGGAAAGSCNGSSVKIVNDAGDPHIQIHVGMDVYRSR